MTWASSYRFSEPLRDVASDEAEQLTDELVRELSPGHRLHGVDLRVLARALPQDEVLVETGAGDVVLVHLTWSGRAEGPPWPTTVQVDSAEHLDELLEFRY